jgi:mono/diheme cytochrome c family protein
MGTSANPVGRWVLLGALVITALMIAYYAVSGNGQVAFGISIVSLASASFIYLFYARMNTVQRTGWMSMIFLILVAVMLPFFYLAQNQVAQARTLAQYDNQLRYAAGLYTTYCSQCHGLFGQGLQGPQLNNDLTYHPNGNPVLGQAQIAATEVNQIITAGILNAGQDPTLKQYLMPQWGQAYGGPLNADDVNALTALVVSGNAAMRQKEGAPDQTNGFNFIPNYLTTSALQTAYQQQLNDLEHPQSASIDLTSKTAVTIDAITTPTGAFQFYYVDTDGKQYSTITIKAGTTVTWVNQSSAIHSVTSGAYPTDANLFPSDAQLTPTAPYIYTFTKAGKYPFFCLYHSNMFGEVDVVPS